MGGRAGCVEDFVRVERRREAAVGLWNAVSALLLPSLTEGFALSLSLSHTHTHTHQCPGSIHSAPSPHRIPVHSSAERGCVALVRSSVLHSDSLSCRLARLQSLSKQNS
jgi:hypothetical protein